MELQRPCRKRKASSDPIPDHWTYTYAQLASSRSFRVLTLLPKSHHPEEIHVTLKEHSISSAPPHIALSYVWGPPPDTATIYIDKKAVKIRPNLYDALEALQQPSEKLTIWIDALCIDQSNIPERNSQVALMWEIYSRASGVFVWLGGLPKNLTSAAEIAVKLPDHLIMSEKGSRPMIAKVEPLFQYLLRNPYWRRGWIRQEILAASEGAVYFGKYSMTWRVFADLALLCRSYRLHVVGSTEEELETFRIRGVSEPLWSIIETRKRRDRGVNVSEDLKGLILKYGMSECMDPRDRVFSLLGLAGGDKELDRKVMLRGRAFERKADYSLTALQMVDMFQGLGAMANGLDFDFREHLMRCLEVEQSERGYIR